MYLANPCVEAVTLEMQRPGSHLGMICTAGQGNKLPPDVPWCADNECFVAEKFSPARFVRLLEQFTAEERARCLFAVAPDVVGDAVATLARFSRWGRLIRHELGFPVAFVGQDGAEHTPIPWSEFDCWFIGGSTEWKLSDPSRRLADEARRRGKHVHMGRVNTHRRIRLARSWGCDTVDGTFLTFGPDQNLPRLLRWMREVNSQGDLFATITGDTRDER